MKDVESFTLDHTTVSAPYVRLVERLTGQRSEAVCKYDIRLVNPDIESLSTVALHTLEHFISFYTRAHFENRIIEILPIDCRTGFYLTIIGEISIDEIQKLFIEILDKVLKENQIPATRAIKCCSYNDHSLLAAKECAKKLLEEFRGKRV